MTSPPKTRGDYEREADTAASEALWALRKHGSASQQYQEACERYEIARSTAARVKR